MDIDCFYTFEEQCSISIPSLVRFDYSNFQRIPLLKNMKSPERAYVVLNTFHTEVDDICQFLKSLSGITDLNFSYMGHMVCFLIQYSASMHIFMSQNQRLKHGA
jgi:hypothetical protein